MIDLSKYFYSIIIFGFLLCNSACAEDNKTSINIVSHCDFYSKDRSIVDIVRNAQNVYIVRTPSGVPKEPLSNISLEVLHDYFNDGLEQLTITAYVVENVQFEEGVRSRVAQHSTPIFLMQFVKNPISFGYEGTSTEDCNVIPTALPNTKYVIAFENDKISLFEPVLDQSNGIREWFDVYFE